MNELEVKEKLDKLIKLGNDRNIEFFGMGQMPINKKTNEIDFEVWELLGELLEDNDFHRFWTEEVMNIDGKKEEKTII